MHITILRLDHRLPRDERITTHVALVARAFGAQEIMYTGQHDTGLEQSVLRLVKQWGGEFTIRYEKQYKKILENYKEKKYKIIHLTMYGIPILEVMEAHFTKTSYERLLIIIGGPHVPGAIFTMADFNVAVTNQPHSEVAALALFLNQLQNSEPLKRAYDQRFKTGKMKIEPTERGKKLTMNDSL